jgi:hypothetical protein
VAVTTRSLFDSSHVILTPTFFENDRGADDDSPSPK